MMGDRSGIDKTALSYWFPKIEAVGLPVPKTRIIAMPPGAQEEVWAALDDKPGNPTSFFYPFIEELIRAGNALGWPCFLRTNHTAGKHQWEQTCHVWSASKIASHVIALAAHSEIVSMPGLPWNTWVVRELLSTIPLGICPRYGNMPVCREFRFFVDGPRVRCWHPYWPKEAISRGAVEPAIDYEGLSRMPNEIVLSRLASDAGAAVGGSWSVDILETKRGWYITDMAEAEKSYHWEGCPNG